MKDFDLQPNFNRIVDFFYRSTFYLFVGYLFFFLTIIFFMSQNWLEQGNRLLEIGAYVTGVFLAICIFVMVIYAISYVHHLWKKGYRKEAAQELLTLIVLNMVAGYVWYYRSKKGFKLSMFH